jgi:uncharacterized membrane protein YeaQ/YmgE (transglycosylase-associated protein family)
MNIFVWILGLFVAHALMYLLLGTDTWLATSLLAAAVWGAALLLIKFAARRWSGEEEEMRR